MLWQHVSLFQRSKTDGSSATEGESEGKESESNQLSVKDTESAMQQMFDEIKRKREGYHRPGIGYVQPAIIILR